MHFAGRRTCCTVGFLIILSILSVHSTTAARAADALARAPEGYLDITTITKAEADAKAAAVRGARVYIDGVPVIDGAGVPRETPLTGHPTAVGQRTVRAELDHRTATKSLYVAADMVIDVRLELEAETGKMLIANMSGKTIGIDCKDGVINDSCKKGEGSVYAGNISVGPHTLTVGDKSTNIEVCRDYLLNVQILPAGEIKLLEPVLKSCRGAWPIAAHPDCPKGVPPDLRYFEECAFGMRWGRPERDIVATFGPPTRKGSEGLTYKHPQKDYSITYHLSNRGGLSKVEVEGRGVPILGDIVSGDTTYGTYGEVVGKLRKIARDLADAKEPDFDAKQRGCPKRVVHHTGNFPHKVEVTSFESKTVSFEFGRLVLQAKCKQQRNPDPDNCKTPFEPHICDHWRIEQSY